MIYVSRTSRGLIIVGDDLPLFLICKNRLNTSAVTWLYSRVDTHLSKLRDTPAARFYRYIIL